jgi:hypothetical protein
MSQKPAHKIRTSNLTVTIWRNISDNGTWYSAVPSRRYKAGDDIWKDTETFGFDDLLLLAKLLDQAHTWIAQQMEADRKARKDAAAKEPAEAAA